MYAGDNQSLAVLPLPNPHNIPLLGEFLIPTFEPPFEWVDRIGYQPRPPLKIRGAMNPWALARTREMWIEEERAWKHIVPLKAQHKVIYNSYIARIKAQTAWIKGLIDKANCQLLDLAEIAPDAARKMAFMAMSFVLGAIPGIGTAITLILALVGALLDRAEKRKIERLVKDFERTLANIKYSIQKIVKLKTDMQNKLISLERQILGWTKVTQAIETKQAAKIAKDLRESWRDDRGRCHFGWKCHK